MFVLQLKIALLLNALQLLMLLAGTLTYEYLETNMFFSIELYDDTVLFIKILIVLNMAVCISILFSRSIMASAIELTESLLLSKLAVPSVTYAVPADL
jgi:hypothetical protein